MDKVFKTSDQALATLLMTMGYICAGAVPTKNSPDPKRRDFVFIDCADGPEIERKYLKFESFDIPIRTYGNKWRTAAGIAKSGMSDEDMEKLRRG